MKQYRLFFSWQNDKKDIRKVISSALEKAVQKFALEGIELIIDQDTRGRVGKRNIATEVLDKICNCDIFVADLTPITKYKPAGQEGLHKLMPNSNVMYEYGYALHAKGENRMIALASIDKANEEYLECMPFDINHDTITTFTDINGLKGLYSWIKKIMEHVDVERAAHIPSYACSLCFLAEEGITDEMTISPRYEKILYISGGSDTTKQEKPTTVFPNWLESIKGIQEACARISTPAVPTLKLVRKTTNHSLVPINLRFFNNGTEPLDNIRLQITANDGRITFAVTNEKETFSITGLNIVAGTSISEKNITHKTSTVNPQDYFDVEKAYVHAPHDVGYFTLHWTMSSRNHRTEGTLTIHVTPEYEYGYRENDSMAGTEEIQDYIEEEY